MQGSISRQFQQVSLQGGSGARGEATKAYEKCGTEHYNSSDMEERDLYDEKDETVPASITVLEGRALAAGETKGSAMS